MRHSHCLSLLKHLSDSQLGKYLFIVDFIYKALFFIILVEFLKEKLGIQRIIEEKFEILLVCHDRHLMISRYYVGIKSSGWLISRIWTVNLTAIIGFFYRGEIKLFGICPWPLLADLSIYHPWIISCLWSFTSAYPASALLSLGWPLFFLLLNIKWISSKHFFCLPLGINLYILYKVTDLPIQTLIAFFPNQ